MRLSDAACRTHLRTTRHGVLATVHAERGVDAVPIVFAIDGDEVFIPVDTVKAKSGARLQRLANIEADPRCVVLVEHWSDDWDELWWVRAHGIGRYVDDAGEWRRLLADRYPQYESDESVTGGIVIRIDALTGWAAAGESQELSGK